MSKELYFCPDLWRLDAQVATTIGGKTEVKGFDGKTVEAWQLADWCYNWSTIRTEITLEPGAEYTLNFWLCGGENDRYDEICQLEVFAEDEHENREIFKLNRGFTKPVLYKNGWYLFSVPFTAPAARTVLRFNIMGAITTLAQADALETYAALTPDAENLDKPQRYNIVFPEGWPKSDSDDALCFTLGGSTVRVTRKQLKTGAKIAGGIAIGALLLRKLRKKK